MFILYLSFKKENKDTLQTGNHVVLFTPNKLKTVTGLYDKLHSVLKT